MYESLLESALVVRLLVVVVPVLAVVVPCTRISLRSGTQRADDIHVMSSAAGFVGAAFIFIGSFANVTAWQGAGASVSNLKNEMSSLAALAESILDYKPEPVLSDAVKAINAYVEKVREVELTDSSNDGLAQSASVDSRTYRTKNAALGVATVQSNEVEQAALDIRSAIINIEIADVVNSRDLDRMLGQVADFQDARRDRVSATWPLVSDVVIVLLLLVTVAVVLIIGFFPTGQSIRLKWLQVGCASVVVCAVWFAVLSTQNLTMSNPSISGPIEAFLSRYK